MYLQLTVSTVVYCVVPAELLTMHVYSPASDLETTGIDRVELKPSSPCNIESISKLNQNLFLSIASSESQKHQI